MNKKDVIELLETIAVYAEIKGDNPFRIAAYRKAAQALEYDVRSLAEIGDFTTIRGIGAGTNDIIVSFIETGKSEVLETLQNDIPAGLIPLLKLPGLGAKRLSRIYKELNVTDALSLKEVCENGKLESLKGFGKKTVENILKGLENVANRPERLPVYDMLKIAETIEAYLKTIPEIDRFSLAGSLRRLKDTIKDIDFIIATATPEKVKETLLKMENVKEVIASGDTKVSLTIEAEYDINVDFRLVEQEAYSTTLHHFTGSKEHNVVMRQLAKERGEKINEYGVEIEETSEIKQFKTETEFFNHFDLHYIPPELREGNKEEIIFREIVDLIDVDHIRGDLHMHTTYSDGAQSIEEMVNAAREKGYEYIAITDHSQFLRVANGLTERRLLEQREQIDHLNEKYDDIHIFAGVEMDILPNGELDFSNDFLKEMDLVIAAIHSGFDQTEEQIMERLCHALDNPYVDIIAHPTGRIIGRRDGYAVNIEQLIQRAKETNTALELNANPMRFDLATDTLRKAREAGVPIAINTDAHRIRNLNYMAYGIRRGRAAMLAPEHVMNTWDINKLTTFLNRNKT